MENSVIDERYNIVEVLSSDERQIIYLAENPDKFDSEQLIVNEFIDPNTIDNLKVCFETSDTNLLSNFVETFHRDSKYYVVGKVCGGSALNEYMAENSLRLSDKMYIAESLLTYFSKLDSFNPSLKSMLCNPDCIAVVGRRNICFNMNIKPNEEDFTAGNKDVIRKAADILCAVYANTPGATLETDKDNIPPSIVNIISNCIDGKYENFSEIHRDFRSSLLYSTFVEGTSVDKQVMKNIAKAKKRKKLSFVKTLLIILLIGSLAYGAWWAKDNLFTSGNPIISDNGDVTPAPSGKNNPPTAKFSLSLNKVVQGDKVVFQNESADPDLNDEITSYEWTMSKDNSVKKLFSNEQSPTYRFDEAGYYVVSLVVKDKQNVESNMYSISFMVYMREEIPPSDGSSTESDDYK